MQKILAFLTTLIVLGFIWFWAFYPDDSKNEYPDAHLQEPNEEVVNLSLAKPKGKMDDPAFLVLTTKQAIKNEPISTHTPPLEARKQLLKQLRGNLNTPLDADLRIELENKALDTQKKIDYLITELNQNINDRDTRMKIKTKIDNLMEEYNELILPLALQAMAEKSNS